MKKLWKLLYWILFIILVCLPFVNALTMDNLRTITNQYTQRPDWIRTSNFTGENLTADFFKGNMDWTNLTNYPISCPIGTHIVQLGDSITCTVPNALNLSNFGEALHLNRSKTVRFGGNVFFGGDINISGDLFVAGLNQSDIGIAKYVVPYTTERGTVINSNYWAWGNGQTPRGSGVGYKSTLKKFQVECTTAGTTLTMEVRKNGGGTTCDLTVGSSANTIYEVECDVDFSSTDILGVYAITETGAYATCVGTAFVEYTQNVFASFVTTVDADFTVIGSLIIKGSDPINEIVEMSLGAAGNLRFDLTQGTDTDKYFDFRSEDDSFGLVIRESDGTATTPYANIYVTDYGDDDYTTITTNSPKDLDALTIYENNTVAVGNEFRAGGKAYMRDDLYADQDIIMGTGNLLYNFSINSSDILFQSPQDYTFYFDDDIISEGNITAENVFLPAIIFAHTDVNITSEGSGAWHNITFNQEVADPKRRITHTYDDDTNDTFIIVDDGYYNINYHLSFADIAPNPTGHIVTRVQLNGEEIDGSLREKDTFRANADTLIGHGNILTYCSTGDEIVTQFATDDTTIALSSHATYGDHKDTAIVTIERIA